MQKKVQAEPGPVPVRDANGAVVLEANNQPEMTPNGATTRWVGSGWTVFNNKGKPVRQYEPYFSDTHHYEFDVRIGKSPILFYDPVARVIATGWALAVLIGVLVSIACGSPDANLNPAVTIGSAVKTGDFSKFLPFVLAQLAGAIVGATLVWLHFYPHWRETPDPDRKSACFFTAPAIRHYPANLFSGFSCR